jgi:amino acid adenylation domain-containing protein
MRQGRLSDAQRASFATRLRRDGTEIAADAMTRRPADADELPLSFGQEQLWFIDQLAPGLPTYNVAGLLHMTGALDVDALRRALGALAARHETLRTRLVSVDGTPHQVIDAPSPQALPVVQVADREALMRLTKDEAAAPFSLDRGPLLRTTLARCADGAHALVVVAHHVVFDGWSFGVLARELAAHYEAAVTGVPAALDELPVQFADYAIWEREQLEGERLEVLVDHWRAALDGAPLLQLPTDRPRPLVQTYTGGQERLEIGREVLDALRALGRREGATLFVTLLTAYAALLHRHTGQGDIVVGAAIANRARPELEPLIAYLVNMLPVRVDLSGDPPFVELLRRVREATLAAYTHRDLPFARLVDSLRVPRDPGRSPVFQVGFTLADGGGDGLRAGEVTMRSELVDLPVARFDLDLSAREVDGGLAISMSYASALFDAATVRRMLGHLRTLLEGVAGDAAAPLSRLPFMTREELRREITEWNANDVTRPPWLLHEKFALQAAATPDATAVELDGERLTYAELDARANRTARHLRDLGIRGESLVGVCMQRSIPRMVALLGILKAGGGYVPLDPDYPPDRLAFMVADARLQVVLTDDASAPSLPPSEATVVSMDGAWPAISALDAADPGVAVPVNGIAYVIYTSGSTGRPKGVVVEHDQAVTFAMDYIELWDIGPADRLLQFSSLNFDVSVLDMFCALLAGAAVVLGRTETLLSPPRLADLIRRERITVMCLPPAVLNLLVDEPLPDLRVVIAGGEAFSSTLVRSWARPGLTFVNGYGPTEATVGITSTRCLVEDVEPPPLGFPLANYQAYVLDRNLQPVPVGVLGELHVGGQGVARGYLARPALTAERFVPDPFRSGHSGRLYRTGDVVRRLADGRLQFLGRMDDQVKIRGYRIELGEIEAVLLQHPGVAQAVVVVGLDRAGERRLTGYVRPVAVDAPPGPAELRRHLAASLPPYMVPAHVLVLESFPLNASAKVDRRALPAPEAVVAAVHVPPRTIIEAFVADLYAHLLNADRVGVEDNFFDLGGNSLQAMRLTALLRRELGVDTDVTSVFLAPSTAELAAVLRDHHGLVDESLDEGVLEQLGQ